MNTGDEYRQSVEAINTYSNCVFHSPPLAGGSLTVCVGRLPPCWEGVGEAGGGGGAGPLVGVWPPGEGAVLLLLRET